VPIYYDKKYPNCRIKKYNVIDFGDFFVQIFFTRCLIQSISSIWNGFFSFSYQYGPMLKLCPVVVPILDLWSKQKPTRICKGTFQSCLLSTALVCSYKNNFKTFPQRLTILNFCCGISHLGFHKIKCCKWPSNQWLFMYCLGLIISIIFENIYFFHFLKSPL
jgi:hypothetical protein